MQVTTVWVAEVLGGMGSAWSTALSPTRAGLVRATERRVYRWSCIGGSSITIDDCSGQQIDKRGFCPVYLSPGMQCFESPCVDLARARLEDSRESSN